MIRLHLLKLCVGEIATLYVNFKYKKSNDEYQIFQISSEPCVLGYSRSFDGYNNVCCDRDVTDDVVATEDPTIIGRGEGASFDVDNNDNWIDITSDPHDEFYFTVEFREDGAFEGARYLGNGGGTYMQVDNRITVYEDEAVSVQLQYIDLWEVQQELKSIKINSEILLMKSGTQIKK